MGDLKHRFGQLGAAHRRRLGWTQGKLAEAADLDDDTIGRIEIGRRGVSIVTIEKFATALEVDPAFYNCTWTWDASGGNWERCLRAS